MTMLRYFPEVLTKEISSFSVICYIRNFSTLPLWKTSSEENGVILYWLSNFLEGRSLKFSLNLLLGDGRNYMRPFLFHPLLNVSQHKF